MKINSFTHVHDPERGSVELAPGKVPEWAEALITNPELIVAESDEDVADVDGAAGDSGAGDGDDDPAVGAPKKGSSAKKWAEYALANGFEVSSDATASQIREDLEKAGVATE